MLDSLPDDDVPLIAAVAAFMGLPFGLLPASFLTVDFALLSCVDADVLAVFCTCSSEAHCKVNARASTCNCSTAYHACQVCTHPHLRW
jgi:hypothetical protein